MREMCPHFGYSYPEVDERQVRASRRDLRISFKEAVETCNFIRGMTLDEAREVLKSVIELKTPVPFKRFKKKLSHRRGLGGAGRYPVKVAKEILKLLDNAEANAEAKGLDLDALVIKHICAQKGIKLKRYIPRAYGRATPRVEQLVHLEVVLEERT
mgnify:CR=1 FL=1